MKKIDELQKIKMFEIITIAASLIGIALSLIHGNLYDDFFNMFSIPGIISFRLGYISLFLYSSLSFVIFTSIFFFNERNPEIRWHSYFQGWLFLTMAVSFYELLNSMMWWTTQNVLSQQLLTSPDIFETKNNYPYHFLSKNKSVIFFGALFVFWILEKNKNRIKNSKHEF
jgi:hypothetical protein